MKRTKLNQITYSIDDNDEETLTVDIGNLDRLDGHIPHDIKITRCDDNRIYVFITLSEKYIDLIVSYQDVNIAKTTTVILPLVKVQEIAHLVREMFYTHQSAPPDNK